METLMKTTRIRNLLAVALECALAAVIGGLAFTTIATTAQAQADPAPTTIVSVQSQSARFSELANLPFPQGSASKETAQALKDELLFQRSTQAYLWAMPAIMSLGMQVGSEKAFGGGYNARSTAGRRSPLNPLISRLTSPLIRYLQLTGDRATPNPNHIRDTTPRLCSEHCSRATRAR